MSSIHRSRISCLFVGACLATGFGAGGPASARPPGPGVAPPPARPAPAQTATTAIELAEPPYRVENLGLSISLPVGAQIESTQVGPAERGFYMRSPDGRWFLRLLTKASTDRNLSADDVAESLIESLLATRALIDPKTGAPKGSGVEILDRTRDLVVQSHPAARFYSAVPAVDGARIVNGYTIFAVEPGRFAILQLDTTAPEFPSVRPAYEMVVATARFEDPNLAAAERKSGLGAAEAFLATLTPEVLLAAAPSEPTLYRLYRPASSGSPADAQEVAFQIIEARPGARGELDPRKPKTRWTAIDREQGILVTVRARYLEGARVIDSESLCFLRPDRESEAWATRMQIKDGAKETGWTETGAREGDDIKVSIDVPASSPVIKQWRRPSAGYLSQVEGFLLPRLLARAGAGGVLQFYQYQPGVTDVRIRRDELAAQPGLSDKDPGGWILRTRRDPDAPEDVSLLDKSGRLLRRTLSGGVVMEPIERDALEKLWKSKGLPF